MALATDDYSAWVAQADIPLSRLTPQLDTLLRAVFCFRQQQGGDYYSTRLLSHFLLHCDCGLKVAQIARLLGIARPTASKQQGMSSKGTIQQAHHRMEGRSHGKLLPRFAGPIAAFLLSHPKAHQAELIDFVAQTFGVHVSRIALYHFLKKYGLNDVAGPAQPSAPVNRTADTATAPSLESPPAETLAPDTSPAARLEASPAATLAPNASPAPLLESPPVAAQASATAPSIAFTPVPLIAANPLAAPTPVIELASAVDPGKPSAPPFSSDGHNTPAPFC